MATNTLHSESVTATASAYSARTPFDVHAAAWRAAKQAYEMHYAECRPAENDDPLHHDVDDASSALVGAMHEAGLAAVRVPSQTVDEVIQKLVIFEKEGLYETDRDTLIELVSFISAEAVRLAA